MTELYTDCEHVVESMKSAADRHDEFTLRIIDAGQVVVCDATRSELDERNLWSEYELIDRTICRLDVEQGDYLGVVFVEISFHEKVVERPFELRPAGVDAIAPKQATDPTDLSDKLSKALSPVAEEWDVAFTFSEVSAASMASGGHYCDFEFEYSIDGVSL